jgi:hypothetical protein
LKPFVNITRIGCVGGTIDKAELALVLWELGHAHSVDDVTRIFAGAKRFATVNPDQCEDDSINFEEFLRMIDADHNQGVVTDFKSLANRVNLKMARHRADFFVSFFVFLTFMVFVNVSSWAIFYLQCETFPDAQSGRQSLLVGDYSISCLSVYYKSNLMFCYAMVAVYPIGIPLMYSVLLYSRRSILRDVEAIAREERTGSPNIGHLSFLISGYKPEMYYFEVR